MAVAPARMYDYYLGGKDNFEPDRSAARAPNIQWGAVGHKP